MIAGKDFSFIQLIGMSGEGVFIASHSDAPRGKSETVVTADSHPACAVNGELTTCPGPRSQDYMISICQLFPSFGAQEILAVAARGRNLAVGDGTRGEKHEISSTLASQSVVRRQQLP